MLIRKVKNPIKVFSLFKAFIGIEIVLFLGSYYFFHRLSTQRDFRYYCYLNWKFSLDYYYQFIKLMGDKEENFKKQDYDVWGIGTKNDASTI